MNKVGIGTLMTKSDFSYSEIYFCSIKVFFFERLQCCDDVASAHETNPKEIKDKVKPVNAEKCK